MDKDKNIKINKIIADIFKDGENAEKERESELVKNFLLAVHCEDKDMGPLKVYLVNLAGGSFFVSQIHGVYCKGFHKKVVRHKESFMLNPDEAHFAITISHYKGYDFTVWFNFFVTTKSGDTYKLVAEISTNSLKEAKEVHINQLPPMEGKYVRLNWSSVEKDEKLLEKTEHENVPEEIVALDIKIREKINNHLHKQRLDKIEESYRIAKTEIAIDEIIKGAKRAIKKIPVFKARPLEKLANKIDYLKREKKKLITRRKKLKEEQDTLSLATKI